LVNSFSNPFVSPLANVEQSQLQDPVLLAFQRRGYGDINTAAIVLPNLTTSWLPFARFLRQICKMMINMLVFTDSSASELEELVGKSGI